MFLRMFLGCFWDMCRMFWDIFMMFLGCFWGCFWDVFGMFLGYLWDVFGIFWDVLGFIRYVSVSFSPLLWNSQTVPASPSHCERGLDPAGSQTSIRSIPKSSTPKKPTNKPETARFGWTKILTRCVKPSQRILVNPGESWWILTDPSQSWSLRSRACTNRAFSSETLQEIHCKWRRDAQNPDESQRIPKNPEGSERWTSTPRRKSGNGRKTANHSVIRCRATLMTV